MEFKRTIFWAAAVCTLCSLAGCSSEDKKTEYEDFLPQSTVTTEEKTTSSGSETTVTQDKDDNAPAADILYSFDDITKGLTYDGDSIWVNEKTEYKALTDILTEECKKTKSNKGVYMFASDDEIIFVAGMNSKEADGETPVNPYTTYEAGGFSTVVTAVAIYQLEEAEKLKLTDTVDKYLPEYEYGSSITIYDLLYGKSGLYDYLSSPKAFWGDAYDSFGGEFNKRLENDEITDEEFMEALNVSGFKHEPGGTVANCTTDMHILAMIIEKITGESYSEYVKKNIFDVCGMEHTSSMAVGDLTSVPDPEMGGDAVVIEMPNTLRGVWDIHSCSADMLSFDRALMHDKLISFDSREKFFTPEKGYAINYACGFYCRDNEYVCAGGEQSYMMIDHIMTGTDFGNLYFIDLESSLRGHFVGENILRRIPEQLKK